MTPDQIIQLRQHLNNIVNEIGCVEPNPTESRCLKYAIQALALLPCSTCNGTEKTIKRILSDAFTEYRQTYRNDETNETLLHPRDKYSDIVSYQAAKVIEYFKCPPCPTCNGIGKIYCDECGGACNFKAVGGNYSTMCSKCDLHGCIPCPDCQ